MAEQEITFFKSPVCPYCASTKKMLTEILPQLGNVKIVEVETMTSKGLQKARDAGCMTVPCITVKGKMVQAGFPKSTAILLEKLKAAL